MSRTTKKKIKKIKKVLKTRFKELDRFLLERDVDWTTEIKNNEILHFRERNVIMNATKYVVGDIIKPIIKNSKLDPKEKILYFTLKTPKEQLNKIITLNNVDIIDDYKITIEEIRKKCEEMAKQGLSIVVIDYVHIVSDEIEKQRKLTKNIMSIAHDLDVIVIMVYQLYESSINLSDSSLELKKNYIKILLHKGINIFALNTVDGNVLKLNIQTSEAEEVFVSE